MTQHMQSHEDANGVINDGEHLIQPAIDHESVEAFDAWLTKEAEEAYANGQTIHMTQDNEYVGLQEAEDDTVFVGYFAI